MTPKIWKEFIPQFHTVPAMNQVECNPFFQKLAEKYGKNAGQIILRFEVQEGMIVLPKSTNPDRIAGRSLLFRIVLQQTFPICSGSRQVCFIGFVDTAIKSNRCFRIENRKNCPVLPPVSVI